MYNFKIKLKIQRRKDLIGERIIVLLKNSFRIMFNVHSKDKDRDRNKNKLREKYRRKNKNKD